MHTRSLAKTAAACLLLSCFAAHAAVPVIEPGQTFTLSENLPAGQLLGTIAASDADGDAIHVFVIGEEENNWNIKPVPFAIDPVTKTLRTTASLNFEHQPVWKLLIGATDGGSEAEPGDTEVIEVTLQDVFDEPIVGPGGESGTYYGIKPDYVGTEAVLNFQPASFGSLPEERELELLLQLPAGVVYLGTEQEVGWNCGYVPHALVCTRDGMATPETAGFKLHLLLPDTPGGIHFVYAIAANNDYVHFDGQTGGLLPLQEVWPHPAPGNLRLVVDPDTDTAEAGKAFRYTISVTDLTDAALGTLGEVTVKLKLDPRWGAIGFKGTHSSWVCAQDGDFATCSRPGIPRGTKAPPIIANLVAPQARGSYFFTAWVSGPPDSDTSNNFATHDTLVQGRPVLDDQTLALSASNPVGFVFGPLVATDDGWPLPATMTFSASGPQPAAFGIQTNGTFVLKAKPVPGIYAAPVRVTDGGGLSDTASVTIIVNAVSPGCEQAGDHDGDGLCNDDDPDDDNDGQPDGEDPCPLDAQNQCCGPQGDQPCNPAADDDGDGIPNGEDNCPTTPNPTQTDTDGDDIGDACDPDDDGDGTPDEGDPCPLDAADECACTAENPDTDGDGICDTTDSDDDGDGQPDTDDPCPLDPQNKCECSAENPDTDGDGICDADDPDDDGDTLPDGDDPCPLDPLNECACDAGNPDTDGDGLCNSDDTDDDGDGTPDGQDPCPLDAGNACCGPQGDQPCSGQGDPDDDGDGVPNSIDNCDAVPNPQQTDTDEDGLGDACDPDDDGDGTPDGSDPCPLDSQNQCSCSASNPDTDGDGQCDGTDPDDDGDGIPDTHDQCPLDTDNVCEGRIFRDGFEES